MTARHRSYLSVLEFLSADPARLRLNRLATLSAPTRVGVFSKAHFFERLLGFLNEVDAGLSQIGQAGKERLSWGKHGALCLVARRLDPTGARVACLRPLLRVHAQQPLGLLLVSCQLFSFGRIQRIGFGRSEVHLLVGLRLGHESKLSDR